MDIYAGFINKHNIQQATTLLEVKGLIAILTYEPGATGVKKLKSFFVAAQALYERPDEFILQRTEPALPKIVIKPFPPHRTFS